MKSKGRKILLNIPRNDEVLLLMQLPESLSPETLEKQNKLSIVSSSPGAQACLVTDTQSFALSRVETSNALVLVPSGIEGNLKPPTQAESGFGANEQPSKKAKTSGQNGKENEHDFLIRSNCHLLGGETGAYFLELQEKELNLDTLQKMLPTFNPFNCYKKFDGGISLTDLACNCQLSESQVKNGLEALQALEYHSKYSLVSEEAWQSVRQAIVAALTECEEFENCCIKNQNRMVSETLKRMAESYPQAEAVIRLVLSKMAKTKDTEQGNILIDFRQVAVIIAHQLFAKALTWAEDELCKEWQAKVPGASQQISLDMLKGVAIRISGSTGTTWEYMPSEKLAKDPKERLRQLFTLRKKWSKVDLLTYLKPLLGSNVDEFLANSTTTISDNRDGEAIYLLVNN